MHRPMRTIHRRVAAGDGPPVTPDQVEAMIPGVTDPAMVEPGDLAFPEDEMEMMASLAAERAESLAAAASGAARSLRWERHGGTHVAAVSGWTAWVRPGVMDATQLRRTALWWIEAPTGEMVVGGHHPTEEGAKRSASQALGTMPVPRLGARAAMVDDIVRNNPLLPSTEVLALVREVMRAG